MKKLKNKVFWTILFILTCFLISIFGLFHYQEYKKEKINIETNLTRLHNNLDKDFKRDTPLSDKQESSLKVEEERKEDFSRRIFMDSVVYTVLLNEENEITEVISHNEGQNNEKEIRKIASQILASDDLGNMKIGNLYVTSYSYYFRNHNFLTIIDTRPIQNKLLSSLKISILLFFVLELILIYLSKIVTSWIIRPAEFSFNKQKQFIEDASHELKTPLSVIMASSDALERDRMEDKWLRNIKNETERMNKLISDLLDLARLEQEVYRENYSTIDLSKIIEMQVLTFESLAFEHHVSFKDEIDKGIQFCCDSDQMKQLISILLDNAIRHSDVKEVILVKLYRKKSEIILSVTNKGETIAKEEQRKIFERFYRADKARSRNENRYGLGLAIAKNIVVNHQGNISVRSDRGYTTFQIVFPMH